jgi:hypothetical protein
MIPQNFFSTIRILHLALSGGTLVTMGALYFVAKNIQTPLQQNNEMLIYIFPIVAASTVGASIFLSKQLLEKTKTAKDLSAKLNQYKIGFLVRWALLEGSCLILMLGFFMTQKILFVGLAGLIWAFLVFQQANVQTFKNDVELSSEERREFESIFQ